MNKVAALVLCLVYSVATLAQTAVTDAGATYIAPRAPTTGTVIAPRAPPPPAPAPSPSAASINPSANQGQQSQDSGAGANNAAGAALIAAGTPMLSNPQTMPMGMALIAMGILALMQGGHDSGAADQSGNTAAVSANSGTSSSSGGSSSTSSGGDSTTTSASDNGAKAAFNSAAGKKAVAAVAAAGGSLTPSSLTMPDGTSVPLSSFSSASGMNAAGFDGNGAMAQVASIEKSLGLKNGLAGASGLATGEGGGGASVSNKFGDLPPFELPKFKSPFDLSADQKAKIAAGKTITMGGDPIGVRGDDIFAMIHRAYEHQGSLDGFITNANSNQDTPSVSVRAPASIVRKK